MISKTTKSLLIITVMLSLLVIIPSSFASDSNADNITVSDNDLISSDYYFDASALNDTGDGSIDNPYKEIKSSRIVDDSTVHIADGVYEYISFKSPKNLVIIGQSASGTVIDCKGTQFRFSGTLSISNLTFLNVQFVSGGNLKASNVVFEKIYSANSDKFSTSYGGAIYSNNNNFNTFLNNCTFTNYHAKYGGAVYISGGQLEAVDCRFVNNTAYYFGGAIAGVDLNSKNPRLKIRNSTFINSTSLNNAGGAIYLKSATLNGDLLNFYNSSSPLGSALTVINSNVNLSNIVAYNNTARGDGGVIYQVYGNLTVGNSIFEGNCARNGAVLFVDEVKNLVVENSSFINNTAQLLAGAIYSLSNNNSRFNNNSFNNNHARYYNDSFDDLTPNLVFLSSNYTLYYDDFTCTFLPAKYDSRDNGYVTSVKNQGDDGNCWAFATLAALESSILKASDGIIDLSENNMKNLASIYSQYGWKMETNEGGYTNMGLGYLTSWVGPILENDDVYFNHGVLSPVLDSIMHVQNMLFIKKENINDINSIKKAIMDYGAVLSGIYMVATSWNPYQCYQGSFPCNHAVALVGWDDDIQIRGAPGKGAWIAKNSWGPNWGKNGYFYVSYYDKSCPKVEDSEGAIAFILKDTIRYDKNYQYDLAKTDYFFKNTNTAWYKNIFTSTDNEYLSAVSTYFDKNTNWDLTISVNNIVRLTKSGFSNPGYYTFDLGEFIPLTKGDTFEVMFKISVDGDVGVPISEKISLNKGYYRSGISYVSWDGNDWIDFYDLEGTYPDHTYDSQVACIKAFTVFNPVNTTLGLTVVKRNSEVCEIEARVLNQYGYLVNAGEVIFSVDGNMTNVSLKNGIARFALDLNSISKVNLSAQFKAEGYVSSKFFCKISNPLVNTTVQLELSDSPYNPINITATVFDVDGNPAGSGFVLFNVSGEFYSIRVENGTARLTDFYMNPGMNNISAHFSDLFYYNSSKASCEFNVSIKNTELKLNFTSSNPKSNNPLNIIASISDLQGRPVISGFVKFNISGEEVTVKVVNGSAELTYIFTKMGVYNISAQFYDKYLYNSSFNATNVTVSKIKVNMTFDMLFDYQQYEVVMGVSIPKALKPFAIVYSEGNFDTVYDSTDGYVIIQLNRDYGTYSYVIKLESPIYEADDLNGTYNVTVRKTDIVMNKATICPDGEYSVILKDSSGNPVSNCQITITAGIKVFKSVTDNDGKAVFNLNLTPGYYTVSCRFDGDEDYVSCEDYAVVNVKSSIIVSNFVLTQNAVLNIEFLSKQATKLINHNVNIVLDGVTHTVKTDGKGVGSLNVNLKPGYYQIRIINPDTGEVLNEYIDVWERFEDNSNVNMYYGAGKSYEVCVSDDYGDIAKGVKVKFTVNGHTYIRKTNSEGYASFKINLKPGKYTIVAEYKGVKVSNKITVKSTIITRDINVKKTKTIKFTAKLVNKNGKILKNKKITFKFKGKTYIVKTNKKGIAILKITKKYRKGKYTITSRYGKLTIKNKIRII